MKKILQKEAPVLRGISQNIPLESIGLPRLQKIIKEMKEALASQDDGVALAAPQIGYPLRIFVISEKISEINKVAKKNPNETNLIENLVYINPILKKISKDKKIVEEGCLSVRYLYGKVSRGNKATVQAYNEYGKKFERGGTGLLAQIFQHEMDHLDGILFIDKAKFVEEILPKKPAQNKKNNGKVRIGVNLTWAFFGTSEVSVSVLEELKRAGLLPSVIITAPDRPKGRKLILTPPQVKIWAQNNNIKFLQPEILDHEFAQKLLAFNLELSVVVAYGKIIPEEILNIPKHKSINIHYSLLPRFRGSAPVEGAILADERETGVSIILMDEKMDHGPIIAQQEINVSNWPPKRTELMESMNVVANKLLIETIPKWLAGEIEPKEQNHDKATFVKMIKKEDALIDLNDDEYLNFRKIMAYEKWPRAYFIKDGKRVIINSAEWKDEKLEILTVTPEGKKEMDYKVFLRGK